ncbi:MAG: IgGFc-binding protein [Myxococcales bacterium]|nr:IgGFc-binding protein [Myxococcales bacterium]
MWNTQIITAGWLAVLHGLVVAACGASGGAEGLSDMTPSDFNAVDVLACPSVCPSVTPHCEPTTGNCVACINDDDCEVGQACVASTCHPIICIDGNKRCLGQNLEVCSHKGTKLENISCQGAQCAGDRCLVCTPNTKACLDDRVVLVCNDDGSDYAPLQACPPEQMCVNGTCSVCAPGQKYCKDGDEWECNSDGTAGEFVKDCDTANTGFVCSAGFCQSQCDVNIKFNTSLGCDYWAADLDNAVDGRLNAQNAPFAVIVSNPSSSLEAKVSVYHQESLIQSVNVAPSELRVLQLPSLNIDGTVKAQLAYRIQASAPVTAFQFNPLDNVDVFSNDASLLLPVNSLGKKYYVMTRRQTHPEFRGYFTIVAAEAGLTTVSFTVTARTLGGDGIPALAAGDSYTTKLEMGDVLNVESDEVGGDLTGSLIVGDQRLVVFGGSEAANVPDTDSCVSGICEFQGWSCKSNLDCPTTCCADHLEQQLPPVSTWGKRFLASRTTPRGNSKDSWRILASQSATVVNTIPYQVYVPPLNEGEWVEFESDQDFMIEASGPILVGQFLASEHAPNPNTDICAYFRSTSKGPGNFCDTFFKSGGIAIPCTSNATCPNISEPHDANIGDPAFILAVPVEQFREDYVFLVPDKYQYNFVNIVAPSDANVFLNGSPLSKGDFQLMGNGFFKVAKMVAEDGVFVLTSDRKLGATVYGWDSYVSYGYPAGQNLTVLTF